MEILGVVLAGGKSTRMGTDKAMLIYQNLTLVEHAAYKLDSICKEVYISVNEENRNKIHHNAQKIPDLYPGEGPISGILSSLITLKSNILVVACDMPQLASEDLSHLINEWDRNAAATMYFHPDTGLHEPLVAIWNYNTLEALQSHYNKGLRSLQSFAKSHCVHKLIPLDPARFFNINEIKDLTKLLDK
jgi:molybdopterin-guanine dinucleotide biosynthesis protein A